MSTDQNADRLDWDTYKELVQVVRDLRLELIAEREAESCPEWKRGMLLDQQIICTEIYARMFERISRSEFPDKKQNDS